MYLKLTKPLIDFTLAFTGLLIASPLFLLIAVLLYFNNGGQIFFTQTRPGKEGELFRIFKFRTMNEKRDNEGRLLPDEERLTLVGKIIRRTSLDELPQLLNVIKGEMSLIGPRPLLPAYLELYDDFQKRRHEVKPGITGWAQVNGRNAISWEKKFEYDVWYVDHLSFLLDLRILFLTIKKVIVSEGINQQGSATIREFTGSI